MHNARKPRIKGRPRPNVQQDNFNNLTIDIDKIDTRCRHNVQFIRQFVDKFNNFSFDEDRKYDLDTDWSMTLSPDLIGKSDLVICLHFCWLISIPNFLAVNTERLSGGAPTW